MYGGRIVRDKLWFFGVYRQVGGERTVPGMFYNKNAGNPNAWAVDFGSIPAGLQQQPGAPGNDPADVAGHAAKQFNCPLVRTTERRKLRPGGALGSAHDAGSVKSSAVHPSRSPMPPGSRQSRQLLAELVGALSAPLPLREAQRRDTQSSNDPAVGADRRAGLCRPGRLHP